VQSQKGVMKLNFFNDFNKLRDNKDEKPLEKNLAIKSLCEDLETKSSLINKIYLFEKQVYLLKCKIEGSLPGAFDVIDEVLRKDKEIL